MEMVESPFGGMISGGKLWLRPFQPAIRQMQKETTGGRSGGFKFGWRTHFGELFNDRLGSNCLIFFRSSPIIDHLIHKSLGLPSIFYLTTACLRFYLHFIWLNFWRLNEVVLPLLGTLYTGEKLT